MAQGIANNRRAPRTVPDGYVRVRRNRSVGVLQVIYDTQIRQTRSQDTKSRVHDLAIVGVQRFLRRQWFCRRFRGWWSDSDRWQYERYVGGRH